MGDFHRHSTGIIETAGAKVARERRREGDDEGSGNTCFLRDMGALAEPLRAPKIQPPIPAPAIGRKDDGDTADRAAYSRIRSRQRLGGTRRVRREQAAT